MLIELHIENLGVIKQASLNFRSGMSVLTGETGAGKTMLVEAIELLVGGRADASMVRSGTAEARVDGRILISDDGEAREVVLARVIPADGRSRAYVDGRPATVGQLAELTAGVIDLHGQHAHQTLLSPSTQRRALDAFGHVDLGPLHEASARLTQLDAELASLGGDERARAREIDLLRFQVAELDSASIDDADEDLTLIREESTLADANAHVEAGEAAAEVLRADGGASDSIAAAIGRVGDREPFTDVVQRLRGVAAELDDAVAELRTITESIEENPERLDVIRVRRALLADLRRKYGATLDEVIAFHATAADRLGELERYEERATELDELRRVALDELNEAATVVGRARRAAAPRLAELVEERLSTLAMPHAKVGVSFADDPTDLAGDQLTFMLSANPGSPLLPLQRVASGGELARTMLALRLVLSADDAETGAATLVFDEVDAGIGGSAAVAVGQALADLGEHHQVLVVTHLAQVAARADQQLVVTKRVDGDTTETEVSAITGETRVEELARMMSGEVTDSAMQHARDLLATSGADAT